MKKKYLTLLLLMSFSFLNAQIISQYVETNSGTNPKGIEIYNNTSATINFADTNLTIWQANGSGTGNAYPAPSLKVTVSDDIDLAPGDVMVIGSTGTFNGTTMSAEVASNNSNCFFKGYNFAFNGDDQLTVKLDGVITDGFGLTTDPGGGIYNSSLSTQNDNIQLLPGIFNGDVDYFSEGNDLGNRFEKVSDTPATSGIAGFGIPPANYVYNGAWRSFNTATNAFVTTAPSFTGSESILIQSGTITIGSSSSVSSTFRNVQVNAGGTLIIDKAADLVLETATGTPLGINASKVWGGDFINNGGTVTMNSDSNEFSSLIAYGDATGSVTYNRHVNDVSTSSPTGSDPGWDLIGSPLINGTLSASTLATNGGYYAIQPYDNTDNTWTSTSSAGTYTTSTAVGYSMATPDNNGAGTTVAFSGVPSARTNITLAITAESGSGTHWNLVSNPYPAYIAIDGSAKDNSSATSGFLWYNGDSVDVLGYTGFDEAIWYWNGSDYVPITNTSSGDTFAAPGQAFFISSASASASLAFRTGFLTTQASIVAEGGGQTGDDYISGDSMDPTSADLFINLSQNEFNGDTELYFNDESTDGLDEGYDVRTFPLASNKIYTRLIEDGDGVNIAVQSLNFDEINDKVIPLGINAEAGEEAIISISHNTTNPSTYVYLEDALEGTFTNLKETDFVITPDSNLEGVGRFFIHTTASTMSNEDATTNLLNVFKLDRNNFITVEGLSTQSNQTNLKLYNILGKEILSTTLLNNTNTQTISTEGLSTGIYVIKLESGNNLLTKKLIIK